MSKKDRVFLINQYEILKLLDDDNEDRYDELITILRDGYEIFYSVIDEWIFDPMPYDDGRFVLDVLSIYRSIETYKRDNPEDEEIQNHNWGFFHGFDGNDEAGFLSFARFLIDTQGKFPEQLAYRDKTDFFNTHFPVLDKYRKMVDQWKALDHNLDNRENILLVLNA